MSISVHTHALHTTMLKPHFITMKRHCGTHVLNIYICVAWLEEKAQNLQHQSDGKDLHKFENQDKKKKKNIRELSACRTLQLNKIFITKASEQT